MGATRRDAALADGQIPQQNWSAPPLADLAQAGVAHWPLADVVALVKTALDGSGVAGRAMAQAVHQAGAAVPLSR